MIALGGACIWKSPGTRLSSPHEALLARIEKSAHCPPIFTVPQMMTHTGQ